MRPHASTVQRRKARNSVSWTRSSTSLAPPGAVQIPSDRRCVPPDELCGRPLITSPVRFDKIMIGRGLWRWGAHPEAGDVGWTGSLSRTIFRAMPRTECDRPSGRFRIRIREQPCRLSSRRHARCRRRGVGRARHPRWGASWSTMIPRCRARAHRGSSSAEARQVRLRNGETLPLLSEVLELLVRQGCVGRGQAPAAAPMTTRCSTCSIAGPARRAMRCTVSITGSFGGWRLVRPDLRRGHSALGVPRRSRLRDAVRRRDALWQEWQQIDRELVDRVHEAGGLVIAWTVNEIGDLERLARHGRGRALRKLPRPHACRARRPGEEASST